MLEFSTINVFTEYEWYFLFTERARKRTRILVVSWLSRYLKAYVAHFGSISIIHLSSDCFGFYIEIFRPRSTNKRIPNFLLD